MPVYKKRLRSRERMGQAASCGVPDMSGPILLSLKVALIAVAIDAVLATLLARLLARREFPGKNLIESLIILPMVLPPTVLGFGLVNLARETRSGWVGSCWIISICRLFLPGGRLFLPLRWFLFHLCIRVPRRLLPASM